MKHSIEFLAFDSEKAKQTLRIFEANAKKLNEYTDSLLWWNAKINLISRNVSRETLKNHILHSLAISQSVLYQEAEKVIDTGTGGGLPGIPLAIADPDKKFILNDIISKKMMACKAMVFGLALKNAQIETGSVEHIQIHSGTVISKHAFKINELLQMISQKEWMHILLLKGRDEMQNEFEGVEEPLSIKVYDLHSGFEDVFFKGKALIEISRG